MRIWALSSNKVVIRSRDATPCLCACMKHPQTAVPGAADNAVVLYFLQALWSHRRIMQSLPHDKNVSPWGSNTDLLFPRQNKCHTRLTLQMHMKKMRRGPIKLQSIVSLCRRQLYCLPTIKNYHNLLKSLCDQVRGRADKHGTARGHTAHETLCRRGEIKLCLSPFPLCLCAERCFPLSQFHEPHCCSQKRAGDKDRRMKFRSQREIEREIFSCKK